MKVLTTVALGLLLIIGTVGIPSPATASHSPHWEHSKKLDGMHGDRHMSGKRGMANLTDQQQTKIDKLRLEHKKKKYLLKAKMRQAKVEFALLITTDAPNKSAIDSKIDQIAELKKEKLQLKASHKIQVRKLLTVDQRVQFDLYVLKKAAKGKHRKGRH
jgi:Spy/CpxP family protein refolding chaperone